MDSNNHPAALPSILRLESRWAFAACWIAVTVIMYLAASPPGGPAVFPDEVCRLGWARLLSGTGPHYYFMGQAAYCQPYYPLLLAPLQWLTDDPATTHRAIFAINSALGAVCLPLAIRLGIRHFDVRAATAWAAGIAILAYPSLTLYSHHALPETLLFAGILLTFTLWCNWVDKPEWRQFTALLAMSILLYAMHRKMIVVPIVLMGGAIVGYWHHRTAEYRMRMLLAALAVAVAFMLDELIKGAALSGHFGARDAGAVDVMARLMSLEKVWNTIGKATGILVYATLVTGGCIWLVLSGGLDLIRRGIHDGFWSLDAFTKKLAFAFGMVVLLVTVTAMASGSNRFDFWFYGRHVDSSLGVALLPAIAMIAKGRVNGTLVRWSIVLAALSFALLVATIPGPPWPDFSPFHVIGAGPFMVWMHQADDRWILLAYCAVILAMTGTVYLARLQGPIRFTALLPFALVTMTTHLMTEPFRGVPLEKAIPEPAARILREADPCHIHFDERNGGRLRGHQIFRLQYYFPNCTIELTPPDDPLPTGSLLVVMSGFAKCAENKECYEMHPDLVLQRIGQN